ncbi:phage tail protein [Enterobacter sp. UNJFSC 003]|uniref:phage tail-collar fiber domain-containing protein n=1 Tax=Enterobacter sp. UNJFSC 003 TaxID=3122077 RepID=UPI002ECD167C|nr:phage tail protein [Serratia liquefaciens]
MSQAVITKAFTEWKAQQAVDNKPVLLDEFIFAFIPGMDVEKPVANTETTPAADKIVHRQAVSKSGVVNGDSVVYSVTLGADVGDFDFNWIGLANKATGTLAMIIHAPTQRKIKNASGQQGNVLVRSMLMEYSGAQAATNITTPAETWQIDFTARLASMDERQRLENIDLYGTAAFFDSGYLVAKSGTQYFVTKGAGYVAGLRTELAANQNIAVSTKPVKVWLDVSWSGTLTSEWTVKSKITVAANLADYMENGSQHYVFALASIDASGNITDLRPKGTLNDQAATDALKKHEQSRNHPDATTSAKGFVQLSSETNSDSEALAATPKAVKAANDNANNRLPVIKNNLSVDLNTLGKATDVGVYQQQANASATTANNYPVNAAGTLFVTPSAYGCQQMYISYSGRIFVRALSGAFDGNGPWTEWNEFFSTKGGTLSGSLAIAMNAPNIALRSTGDDTRQYIMSYKKDGSNSWYVGKANANSESLMLWNYQSNSGIEIDVNGRISLRANGKTVIFNPDGTFDGEIIGKTANNFRIAYGNYGSFWRNDGNNLYLMLTDSGAPLGSYNSLRPLRVNLSTGEVVFGEGVNATKGISAGYVGAYAWDQQYNTTAAYYQDFSSAGTSEYHPLIKQRARLSSNAWVFSMGALISGTALSWHLHIRGSAGQEHNHKWDTSGNYSCPGQVTPADYTNFDARYYTKTLSDSRYYTKAQSDAGYMAKTGAYTKAESEARYQAKGNYITGVRLGASAEYQERGNSERMTGGVMTSFADRGSSNYWIRLRPLQYQINGGSWVTAAYA